KSFIQLVQDGAAPTNTGAAAVADALNEVFKNGSVRARALADGTTVVLEGSATGEQAEQARKVAQAMSRGVTVVDVFGATGGIHIGGEIPIPVAQQAGSGVGTSITVEYKPFGIRLDVEALSITDEWVTLRISPEVSALDYTNAVTVNGFNLPALTTRRADSVV